MKHIELTKQFEKSYKKRIAPHPKFKSAYIASMRAFKDGDRSHHINDHPLRGKLKGKRAFSVANDVRVVYEETDEAYLFLDVGSHNQVYN